MQWGKVYSLDVSEDSQAVAAGLAKQAQAGIEEAAAPKITIRICCDAQRHPFLADVVTWPPRPEGNAHEATGFRHPSR
jgi:hypothetical protein